MSSATSYRRARRLRRTFGGASAPRRQPALCDAAGDGVGRIEDIADVVANDLAEQVARGDLVEPIVGNQPVQHFRCRVLKSLIERTRVADGDDVVGGFSPRPDL